METFCMLKNFFNLSGSQNSMRGENQIYPKVWRGVKSTQFVMQNENSDDAQQW